MKGRKKLTEHLLESGEITAHFLPAVIQNVQSGAATDGNALVTVTLLGEQFNASYSSAYSPVIGHTVLVLMQGSIPHIMHRMIGTP
jgi:hypothetical protein